MFAAMSGNIYVMAECLNRGMNPFNKDGLNMTTRDHAISFQNVSGTNFTTLVEKAMEQWSTQLSPEQIAERTT